MKIPETNPFKAVQQALAYSDRDWSENAEDAALWAIVFGWDNDDGNPKNSAMDEVAKKHGWDEAMVERLRCLHKEWVAARRLHENPPMQLRPWSPADYRTIQGFEENE